MPRILHLSDLHFGAHDERLVAAVEERVHEDKPDLVVVSGDFTQRARTEQFKEACRFLDRLREAGHEVLGVPGNHDVPLYDVMRRFLSPLTRYKRYIDDVLCPYHELPGVAVLGVNTARSLTFKDGRISHEQMDFIRDTFGKIDPSWASRSAGRSWRSTRSSIAASTCCSPDTITERRCTTPATWSRGRAGRWWCKRARRLRRGFGTRSRASTASTSTEMR